LLEHTLPVRSNTYQRLVVAIHDQLGPEWTVTESRMLKDLRTGQPREVDVVLEGHGGGYPLMIGIEARDRGRVADVTWVEAMAQKHADLPTDKVVLWSPTGFSKNAAVKSRSLGLVTITTKTLDAAPWATIARRFSGGAMKWVKPTFDLCVDVYLSTGEAVRWPATRDTVIRETSTGAEITLGAILTHIEHSPEVRTALLDHTTEGLADFHAVFQPPIRCEVVGPNGETAVLKRALISLKTACEVGPMTLQTIVHENVATSLGELQVSDGTLRVLVREPERGESSVRVTHLQSGDCSRSPKAPRT
jgi:hypothetical protein